MSKNSIADQLESARVVFNFISDDPILRERMAQFGYDEPVIAEGQALYQAAVQARNANHDAQGNKLGATDALAVTQRNLRKSITDLRRVLQVDYGNNRDTMERLALRPTRRSGSTIDKDGQVRRRLARTQATLLDQARTLYTNVLNDQTILASLTRRGYTSQSLQAEQALIAELERLDTEQENFFIEAKARVAEQTLALKAMNTWLQRLRNLARVKLQDQPKLLEKLKG